MHFDVSKKWLEKSEFVLQTEANSVKVDFLRRIPVIDSYIKEIIMDF